MYSVVTEQYQVTRISKHLTFLSTSRDKRIICPASKLIERLSQAVNVLLKRLSVSSVRPTDFKEWLRSRANASFESEFDPATSKPSSTEEERSIFVTTRGFP